MRYEAVLRLSAEARSAGDARRFVARRCIDLGLESICEDVILPVSELVTNVVLHTGSSAVLRVGVVDDFLEVAVQDSSPRLPIVRPVRLDPRADIDSAARTSPELPEDLRDGLLHVGAAGSVAAGRGLLIVDAVADEWGVQELVGGKTVWFRIRLPADWTPADVIHVHPGP